MTRITGWHVAAFFGLCFGTIIAVNATLAWHAVRSFPGLEVKNSYVASQAFERARAAQLALDWEVAAWLEGEVLRLSITEGGRPVAPKIERAVFGRATSVAADQMPAFVFDGASHFAPVAAGPGNWNLRLAARADNGTLFQQRVVVRPAQ